MAEIIATKNGSAGIELLNLLRDGAPVLRNEVTVNFSPEFNRKTSQDIDDMIHKVWEEKCQVNSRLYNGSKFRFAGVHTMSSGHVCFNVGITSYKELMATNCHINGKELVEIGLKHFNCKHSYFSDAFAVGSLIRTSDNQFLFIKRALWTGEEVGRIDRVGGHPEPENIYSDPSGTYSQLNPFHVRDEIFNSVLQEIVSEVNLPLDTLQDPVLLGTVRTLKSYGRPTAEFFVSCSLTSHEAKEFYEKGTQSEADETVGIIFIQQQDLYKQFLDPTIWKNLTDAACGAIELYSRSPLL